MIYTFPCVLHHDSEGWWSEFPDLPGCFTKGKDDNELISKSTEALKLYLAVLLKNREIITRPAPVCTIPTSYPVATLNISVAMPVPVKPLDMKKEQRQSVIESAKRRNELCDPDCPPLTPGDLRKAVHVQFVPGMSDKEKERTVDAYVELPHRFVIVPDPKIGRYLGTFPELPGCSASADSFVNVCQKLSEAKRAWVEATLEAGRQIPYPVNLNDDAPSDNPESEDFRQLSASAALKSQKQLDAFKVQTERLTHLLEFLVDSKALDSLPRFIQFEAKTQIRNARDLVSKT